MRRTVPALIGMAVVAVGLLGCKPKLDYEVVATVEARLPDGHGKLTVSEDGLHVAYVAPRGGKSHVVVDGKEQQGFDHIWDLTSSEDGTRIAYGARKDGRRVVVVDDAIVSGRHDWTRVWGFSPDGRRVAFSVHNAGKRRAIVDGEEGREYDFLGGFTFSPNGAR